MGKPRPTEDEPNDALRQRGTPKAARGVKDRGIAPHKRIGPSDLRLTQTKTERVGDRLHLLDEDYRLTDPDLGKGKLTPPSIVDRYHRYLAKPPDTPEPRILRTGNERRASILAGRPKADAPVLIKLAPAAPKASGDKPFYEKPEASQVPIFDPIITKVAEGFDVDPDLIRAIMYMETTHGYYDLVPDRLSVNKTILPMNVHVEYWKGLGVTRESLHNPLKNIIAGTIILKGIRDRVGDAPTVEEIATLYQNLSADQVSRYGLRVADIYRSKLWEKK